MNSTSPLVTIILLNYNCAQDTIDCLRSLEKISYSNYKIIIVDNASTDDSVDKIKNYLVDNKVQYSLFDFLNQEEEDSKDVLISLIKNNHNGGYGYGNNVGIKYALKNKADYVLILNNDTIVKSDFLEPMVWMSKKDQRIGIVSGKIYFKQKTDIIWFNGGKFSTLTGKTTHFNFNEKDVGQLPSEPITFISGCMWLIPRQVIEKVGLINEEYFMYIEDLEYCQRVIGMGYTLSIASESNIFHKVGSSTGGRYTSFSVFNRTKNMNKFLLNNKKIIYRIISIMIFNLTTILQIIRSTKISLLKDYFSALIVLFKVGKRAS